MRCPSCNSQNPDDARFCDACGTSLPRRCPVCGAPNRTTAKFCNGCGAALGQEMQLRVAPSRQTEGSQAANLAFALRTAVEPQSVPEGERKLVTALFVDITGSTELEQDIDPEEARAIIDPALGLMIDAVRRYDGYVVQSTGDGIFALFGAPRECCSWSAIGPNTRIDGSTEPGALGCGLRRLERTARMRCFRPFSAILKRWRRLRN